ncbi:MAG: nucleoid occlusion factor SlmA [Gammaproteobacteria bacterium]|nr:nucleoid occlusion factor SlmA [Gammaproteobacteria bacterium]MDH5728962.1 nucleoid occlusion factor SlmA [Gammaproteobacteria bacterium]
MVNANAEKKPRRQQILEALAGELETSPGAPITTAGLARAVGISEAALYRHFPSKAKMFEALIEFSEETIFGLITRIQNEETGALSRCEKTLKLILGFSSRNPGITRILIGDALVGENQRLRVRVNQFNERIETQIKQFLREGVMHGELPANSQISAIANLIISVAEGRMSQYVRSSFNRNPMEFWDQQWPIMMACIASESEDLALAVS